MKRPLRTRYESIWNQLLPASARKNNTLQDALRTSLVQAILSGKISSNTRLPSTRELSALLKVARITVALTYERLAMEGFLQPRARLGYFVAAKIPRSTPVEPETRVRGQNALDWNKRMVLPDQQDKWLEKPRDWQSFRFPFVYGQLDPKLFPLTEWRECSWLAQSVPDRSCWAADAIDVDDPMLISEIVHRVLTKRGIVAQPQQVLITVGTQMALYLLAEILIAPRTSVAFEDPGYMDARNMLLRRGANLVWLQVDDYGAVLPDKLAQCSYFYCTPSHQCPTGVTLSLERRLEVLRLAEVHDLVLIEDDYEAETQFVGPPSPALKAMDRSDRVIYIGGFSKILSPGLRVGYIVASPEFIEAARRLRRLIIRHPPRNNQRALALFIAQGHYDRILFRNRDSLEARARCISEACSYYLPDWKFRRPIGGSALWMQVPDTISVPEVVMEARRHSVLIEQGAAFFAPPVREANFVRLAYSSIPLEQIRPGIEKLAKVVKICARRKSTVR